MTRKPWLAGGIVLIVAAALFWRQDIGPQLGQQLGQQLGLTPGTDSGSSTSSTSGPGRGGREVRPVAVEAGKVEQGSIQAWIAFTGSLTAGSQFDVAARTTGRLEQLLVDIGDTVEPGQVIARLDDEESVQLLEQARAELAVARAGLAESQAAKDAAERSLRRTRELREQRVASQSELDAAETEASAQAARVELSRSQIAQREAALRSAEIRQSYTTLRATWQGGNGTRVVGERYADEGTLLQANTAVLSLVSLDPLRGVVFAAERSYARLRLGQTVEITSDALPGKRFQGELVRLAPVFSESSRQARVEIRVPNPDGLLKPGMFIRSRIQVDADDHATIIPLDAVVSRDQGRGVYRVSDDGGRAEFVKLELGIEDGNRVQVLSPDLSGRVVTLGQQTLSDGVPIRVVNPVPDDALEADGRAGDGTGEGAGGSADQGTADRTSARASNAGNAGSGQ